MAPAARRRAVTCLFAAHARVVALALACGVSLVAGCGGALRPAPSASVATNGHAPAASGWLVWLEGTPPRTVWLDEDGALRGAGEGVLIGAAGRVWELSIEALTARLATCEALEAGAIENVDAFEGAEGRATSVRARALGAREERVLDEAPPIDRATFAEFDDAIELVGGLGPLVFARRRTRTFACGAHGDTQATARVFDLARGVSLDPASIGGDDAHLEAEAARRLTAARAGAPDEADDAEAPTRVAVEPRFGPGGVVAAHAFAVETCYACGDGRWSSYTRLAEVESAHLPDAWDAHARWPAAVRAWVDAHPGVRGVSRADGDEAALRARLR